MLDVNVHGTASRLSPEAVVPVVLTSSVSRAPGGAANVALNIAATGRFDHVTLVASVADDDSGRVLRSMLQAGGVDISGVVTSSATTTTKRRVFVGTQLVSREDTERLLGQEFPLLAEHVRIDSKTIVVVSDYAKGVVANAQTLLQRAHDAGAFIVVDPKCDLNLYGHVNVLKPNEHEMGVLCGGDVQMLFESLPFLTQVILTRGGAGVDIIERDGSVNHADNPPGVVAVDVVGAGDTVLSMVCVLLQSCDRIDNAMLLAETGAAAVVNTGTMVLDGAAIDTLYLRSRARL